MISDTVSLLELQSQSSHTPSALGLFITHVSLHTRPPPPPPPPPFPYCMLHTTSLIAALEDGQHSCTYRELDLPPDIGKVLVPFPDAGLVGSKVRAHEAEGGGMEEEVDGHCSLVACLPRHTRLHRAHGNVPGWCAIQQLTLQLCQPPCSQARQGQLSLDSSGPGISIPHAASGSTTVAWIFGELRGLISCK